MRTVKTILTSVLVMLAANALAQSTENFDIASFNIPRNWKKSVNSNVASYTKTSNTDGGYCVIAVYKSAASLGSLDKDYNNDWKELVADRFTVNGTPETETQKRNDGWQVKSGAGAIKTDNGDAIAILSVFTDGTTSMSVLSLLNKEEYLADAENTISSIKFRNVPPITKSNVEKSTPRPASTAGGKYQFTTSNFDDGWTSTVQNDYVLVEKGNNAVYLLYHVPYNSSQFSGTGLRDAEYYWDNYVTKYFSIQSKQFNDAGQLPKPAYMEGYGTDRRTGKSCFIGMCLIIIPNATSLVIGTAPNEAAFRSTYREANSFATSGLAAMTRYNKFAVGPGDVIGKWQEGGTNTAQWYYTSPSGYEGYAGMTAAATSATFNFYANGTYTSIHNGAYGAVGSMNTFQQNYKGKYTVTNWQITATNRWEGKTEAMPAHFEVVRGGRILHLGRMYKLVKVK